MWVWKSRQSMQRPNEQQKRLSSWAINYYGTECVMLKWKSGDEKNNVHNVNNSRGVSLGGLVI